MKITIIGGGGVIGSSAAYRIAQTGLASEIVLFDSLRNIAEAHALDIEQAVAERVTTTVYAGEIRDTKGSDIVIMTASGPRRSSLSSRSEFLPQNLPTVLGLAELLLEQSPSAIWIITTSPVDPLVYLVHSTFAVPRQKIIGLNWNDTVRFRWAIAKTLCIPSNTVEAFVLGEHGETQVPLFSRIQIHGKRVLLNPEQRNQVQIEISNFLPKWIKLQPGRSPGWTTAESIGSIFKGIVSPDEKIWVCSTPLLGEYGLSKVSLGVPVKVGLEGVKSVIEFDLDSVERNALEASAQIVKKQIGEGQTLVNGS